MRMNLALTFHDSRQLGSPFHTPESGPTPDTPSDQLEPPLASQPEFYDTSTGGPNSRSCRNLFPGSCNTDDSRDAPSFVACLESSTHDVDLYGIVASTTVTSVKSSLAFVATHIPRGVKCVVKPTVRELDKMVLNTLAFGQLQRVDEIGRTELACPRFLCGIYVNSEHARCPNEAGGIDTA
jgi:hypothetical protein